MARTPNREEIERRAYEIYEERGHEQGHELDHWLAAEQECARKLSIGEPETRSRTAVAQGTSRPSYAGTRRS